MIQEPLTIINKLGLHARAAAKLVTLACSFKSDIQLQCKGKTANGKSIMSVMMLAAAKGSEITFIIHGPDESTAFSALNQIINHRIDEEE